jgi:hypothetical protein
MCGWYYFYYIDRLVLPQLQQAAASSDITHATKFEQ